jgi:hypothetical protein
MCIRAASPFALHAADQWFDIGCNGPDELVLYRFGARLNDSDCKTCLSFNRFECFVTVGYFEFPTRRFVPMQSARLKVV